MLKATRYLSITLGALLLIPFFAFPSAAQELAWYVSEFEDPVTKQTDLVKSILGVEQGVLVGGWVMQNSTPQGDYLRRIDAEGRELWRLDIAPSGRVTDPYISYDTPLIAPHARGGWWYVARYLTRNFGERFYVSDTMSPTTDGSSPPKRGWGIRIWSGRTGRLSS